MRNWYPDEQRTVGPEHLDAAYVAGYDAKAQVDPTDDIEALRAAGMDGTSVVVDLGAGTGAFTVAAAGVAAQVVAVDPSPVMVAALRRRIAEAGLTNVTVVQAGFLSYRHQGAPVDVVHSRHALHQLPDFWKVVALRDVSRLLRQGGLLRLRDLVLDIAPGEVEATVEAWMSRAVGDPARGYTAAELAEHLRSEFSTFTWLLEPMLDRTGFELLDREIRSSIYSA